LLQHHHLHLARTELLRDLVLELLTTRVPLEDALRVHLTKCICRATLNLMERKLLRLAELVHVDRHPALGVAPHRREQVLVVVHRRELALGVDLSETRTATGTRHLQVVERSRRLRHVGLRRAESAGHRARRTDESVLPCHVGAGHHRLRHLRL
jgi:hypothetical protein